jgi:predicted oxidoreductase
MSTCANCTETAAYVYEISETHTIDYCETHLPRFLVDRKNAGLLKSPDFLTEARAEALDILSSKNAKKKKSAVEEAVVEEPLVEVPVVEEPLPTEDPAPTE